jgi:hypothetical protein
MIWPQNHSLGFPDLDLKTGGYGLVIWPTKSPRWFLGLGLKTKWAMVCRLHHKTNGRMKMCRAHIRSSGLLYLEASQARVSQSILKTGGGAAWMAHVAASDSSTPTLSFLLY